MTIQAKNSAFSISLNLSAEVDCVFVVKCEMYEVVM